ncbi:hypothetical protein ACP3WZ_25265 [Salmonella enterica]|uniref:hypothetical protein n=1 Tax=Salmonella enterica TaxID=28901 RepID=UPI003CF6F566
MMNVVAFCTSDKPWKDATKLTVPSTRENVLKDFDSFGPTVKSLLQLAEPTLDTVSRPFPNIEYS